MPELPEVEIVARRLGAELEGARVERVRSPGIATMKTYDPPLSALDGGEVAGARRIGKMAVLELRTASGERLDLLIHLMSAGRLAVRDERASARDRRLRLAVELADGRELRLRELGTRQSAWAKLLPADAVAADEAVAKLGPEAWPAPAREAFAELIDEPRHLHPLLRDQRVIAGIGRSWVDEILWRARLSPFKQGGVLEGDEVDALHGALAVLGEAIEHYEEVVGERPGEKLPMPLEVHKREGSPCPRCGETLAAVHFAEHSTTYCPAEQTGGRVLKDRRLSRLLR